MQWFSRLRRLLAPSRYILLLLLIEFLDEFVYGAGEAAWPLIRADLALSYLQIGFLLSLPRLIGSFVEVPLFIFGDMRRPDGSTHRKRLVMAGGLAFMLALLLTAVSRSFWPLMIAFVIFNPASGAFVNLSQASLMDASPAQREQNMARWTFAGSLGVVIGPLALGGAVVIGAGWRGLYLLFAALALVLVLAALRHPFQVGKETEEEGEPAPEGFFTGLRRAFGALRRGEVLRWLVLLEFSDFMLDVLYSYLALYLVDVAGVPPAQAGLGVAVWAGVGLLGDFLLIPLLARVPGLVYLRVSALLELALYPAFLLAPNLPAKLVLLGLLGFFNSGWFAILKAQLYASMPGQSAASNAVNNFSGLLGSLIPLGLGWLAQRYNLQTAMWLLLLGPVALLVGLPRRGLPVSQENSGSAHDEL